MLVMRLFPEPSGQAADMKSHRRWYFLALLVLPLALLARRDPSGESPTPPVEASHLPAPAADPAPVVADTAPVLPLSGIRDAVQTPEGWILLDQRMARLMWLDRRGRPLRSVGREGEGPGEMDSPLAVVVVGGRILVFESTGRVAHAFGADGRFLERVRVPNGDCPAGFLVDANAAAGAVVLLRTCFGAPGSISTHVQRWEPGGEVRTVHQWAPRRPLVRMEPFRTPSAAALPSGVAVAVAYDPCALRLEPGGGSVSLCYPESSRPPLRAKMLDDVHRVLGPRSRSMGFELVIPPRSPRFERVVAFGPRLAFVVRPREGSLAVDVVSDGGVLRRREVRDADRIFAGSHSVLAVRDMLEGPAVTIVDLP